MLRHRVKHTTSLKERTTESAKAIATRAGALPLGSKERERRAAEIDLMRKNASEVYEIVFAEKPERSGLVVT